ncbi:MAG: type II toxin-antitoxin system YhaV family toxin [Beijerinckiaceae bacterium]|nr:type II toxin-antitoxin system YhaV family toxin [Beijerinckiaceae bacterium]
MARSPSDPALVVNGWAIYAHPLLLDQIAALIAAVEREKRKSPAVAANTANAKLLAALRRLILVTIPADPSRPEYRQGGTLGPKRKHWFRAKFGNGRFRLFFRFDSRAKIIIFAWLNDQTTLRAYGSRTDAYATFRSMLDRGNPPDDWTSLMKAVSDRHGKAMPFDV